MDSPPSLFPQRNRTSPASPPLRGFFMSGALALVAPSKPAIASGGNIKALAAGTLRISTFEGARELGAWEIVVLYTGQPEVIAPGLEGAPDQA